VARLVIDTRRAAGGTTTRALPIHQAMALAAAPSFYKGGSAATNSPKLSVLTATGGAPVITVGFGGTNTCGRDYCKRAFIPTAGHSP